MRIEIWTGLCRKSKTFSVFDGAKRAKRNLDPLLVVPPDVGIDYLNELLNGRGLPVQRVELFCFQSPEGAPHAALSGPDRGHVYYWNYYGEKAANLRQRLFHL